MLHCNFWLLWFVKKPYVLTTERRAALRGEQAKASWSVGVRNVESRGEYRGAHAKNATIGQQRKAFPGETSRRHQEKTSAACWNALPQ